MLNSIRIQAIRKLQSERMPKEHAGELGKPRAEITKQPLKQCWSRLPERPLPDCLKQTAQPVRKALSDYGWTQSTRGRSIMANAIQPERRKTLNFFLAFFNRNLKQKIYPFRTPFLQLCFFYRCRAFSVPRRRYQHLIAERGTPQSCASMHGRGEVAGP